ncbi:hypothetical protein B0H10DRAFT_1995279 [Mycena sp. CBHHK59/15]|nr:hypothetical protein B0H10DRAFT_1995279 [Mycena sp. CBHHK59/15]
MFSRQRVVRVFLLSAFGASATLYLFLPDRTRSAPTLDNVSLSPSHFTRGTLTSSKSSGPNTKLLTLTVHGLPACDKSSLLAPIWSVYIKDDDIQVERPFTPLEGIDEHGQMLFWVKKYPKGESKTRFSLLHSSPTLADLPPSEILGPLQAYSAANPEKFRFHLFVDTREGEYLLIKPAIQQALGLNTPWWRTIFSRPPVVSSAAPRKILFLTNARMTNAIAGPYGRNFSQGQVCGVLGEMGYTSKEVRKL